MKMEKLFYLDQHGTTVSTEIRAGLTTFVAMAYIIFLNPVYLSAAGMDSAGVLAATCLSAALGTALSAFLSNSPFAMASGMGMNAYFTYTLCFGCGYSWQQALALTFLSGCLFLILALTAGKKAVTFIPENLRHAITAGIGLFIMLIGLLDAGFIRMTAGFPELGDLGSLRGLTTLLGLAVVTVYAESAAGVEAGGRTGLAALTTAFCFLLAVFFSPAASIFNSTVTAPALIVVGICLLMDIRKVRFDSMDEVIPAMLTVVMMPFAYSITVGIAVGFLSYLLCKLAARKYRELNASTVVLCLLFALYFVLK